MESQNPIGRAIYIFATGILLAYWSLDARVSGNIVFFSKDRGFEYNECCFNQQGGLKFGDGFRIGPNG